MSKKLILFFSFSFYLGTISLFGQVPNILNPKKATAATELAKRGVTELELQEKLAEKGIYLTDLQSMTAEDALKFQVIIEQAISELEAEKSLTQSDEFRAADTSVRPAEIRPLKKKVADPVVTDGDDVTTSDADEDSGGDISGKKKIDTIPYLPPVKTSRTANTQSAIRAQPVDISSLIYGQEIFKNKSLQVYNKAENIKPPETYVLGVGDILNISIFGRSKIDFKNLEVNPQGFIQFSSFPRIYLKGLTFLQAKQVIRQTLATYYAFEANEYAVTINYSREIGINIYGEAENIGTFNLPATNTAINALVAAGGPNKIGSVRNIKLIRGKTAKIIDIYEFINNPAKAQDFYLEQNDVIHIPIAERVVSITGAVRRPMRYELKTGENLIKLIEYAAGLREDAYRKSIQIKRYIDDRERIIDVPLKALIDSTDDFTVLSGDIVTIRTIPVPLEQVVTIDGRVETPGTYEFTEGMKVLDLLEKGQVRKEAKTDLAFLMRLNDDGTYSVHRINVKKILDDATAVENITLKIQDRLLIYSLSSYIDAAYVSLGGAVRQGINVPFDPKRTLRISDLIIMGGGLVEDALDFGYIKRINKENYVERDYILFYTKQAMADPGGPADLILEPNDQLIIYNDRTFFDETFVNISGAVRRGGKFAYGPGFTLKDLVIQAGGFTMEAATNRIEIFRVIIDENKPTKTVVANLTLNRDITLNNEDGRYLLKPYDQVFVRAVPDFEMQQNVTIQGEVQFPGTYALIKENETLLDLLRRAGGPTQESFMEGATLLRYQDNIGYIVFEMPQALRNPTGTDNLILKKGDVLSIPKVIDFVRVEGAIDAKELYEDKLIGTNNRINVAYIPNKNAKYYVDEFAAGVAREGDKGRITILRPNGRILKTKNYLLFKVYPKVEKGAIVRVGVRDQPTVRQRKTKVSVEIGPDGRVVRTIPRRKVDWAKTVSDVMSQATAVLSLILLTKTALKT